VDCKYKRENIPVSSLFSFSVGGSPLFIGHGAARCIQSMTNDRSQMEPVIYRKFFAWLLEFIAACRKEPLRGTGNERTP
jgi:hypothetical protein